MREPKTLKQAADMLDQIRTDLLFDDDVESPAAESQMSVFAEQHFITALALIDQAASQIKLANLYVSKELGAKHENY